MLYPAFPFQLGTIDDTYAAEAEAMQAVGFGCSTISIEDLEQGSFKVRPRLPQGATILYRGWMMNTQTYQRYVSGVEAAACTVFTDTQTYLTCHHIPGWYSLIPDLTPETKFFDLHDDLENELRRLGWQGFFIKDYVKSLKTSRGSIITDPSDITDLVTQMQQYRGEIEGGFSVRRLESFVRESESRYFVIHSQAFAVEGLPPHIVTECARRIPSRFFSVDVATREDGTLRVIEIGDGQVSDTVGWEVDHFASILKQQLLT